MVGYPGCSGIQLVLQTKLRKATSQLLVVLMAVAS